ncbi:MAG: 3-isopropylmalate dehydratase large subunit [bacterium]|nr:3-isopropylmalate dehydratase large subunit [bacterium]
MGMTITEKILAKHANLDSVKAGQFIEANVDIALGNDITAPLAIKEFKKLGIKKVFDKNKVSLIPDHFTPNKDIKSAEQSKILREFAKDQDLTHYYDQADVGVEHVLLPEKGIVVPGDLVIGADSHTCTYGALGAFSTGVGSTDLATTMAIGKVWLKVPETIKFVITGKLPQGVYGKDIILHIIGIIGVGGALYRAMEFTGDTIENLNMADRMTICNMAIEAGGKSGIITPDAITEEYVKSRAQRPYEFFASDPDAKYLEVIHIDTTKLEPKIAFPHLPSNIKNISEAKNIKIDQVVIGSCTNGRIEDLRIAANILKGKTVNENTRLLIIPTTPLIYKQAMEEGLFSIFLDAKATISPPTCGPCLGGHMGVLAKGEKALTTTNRNFVGRMGHPESEVYLCSPAVAAASAIKGEIVAP